MRNKEINLHLHSQLFEGVDEHLDLLLRHLVRLERGSKGDKDRSLSRRVHELFQIAFQWLRIFQLKSANLGRVRL